MKKPSPENVIISSVGILFFALIGSALWMKGQNPGVDVCRTVVMKDIQSSQQYQAQLDQMLRPDMVDELMKQKQATK